MSLAYQAHNVRAAFGDGVAVTTVRLFNAGLTSLNSAVPEDFKGKYVFMQAEAADCHFFFSLNSAAVADVITTGGDAGASSVSMGEVLSTASARPVRVPWAPEGTPVYFVREATAAGARVRMTLSSD